MIEVIAPAGFKPTKATTVTESQEDDASSGNFEDIDSLLANAQPPNTAAPTKHPQGSASVSDSGRSQPQSKPAPSAPAAGGPPPSGAAAKGSPTMPVAQWDTEATKQKKRLLQIVMLALAAIVGLGIGIWALTGGGSTQPAVVQDDSLSTTEAADPLITDPLTAAPSTAQANGPNAAVTTGEVHGEESPLSTTEPKPVEPPTATPASVTALQPQPLIDNSAGKSAPPPLPSDPARSTTVAPLTPPENPLATPLRPTADPQPPAEPDSPASPLIASTENSLGTLSKILQGQGTSLQQIQDIAQIQKEQALIGTPTYLIQRPNNKPVQVDRQLSAELSGWKLDNVPLIDAIADLEMLSDIPVTIDPALFGDGNFNILRPVSFQVESLTFKAAFEKLLVDDGLIIQPTPSGLRITSRASSSVVTKSYPQSFCTDEKSSARLKDLIVAVTGINDWNDNDQFKLDVTTDSVTVSHLPKHQATVAGLMKKLNAAADYQSAPDALQENLRPLALQAEEVLATSPNLKTINPYRRSMRIGSLLRTVRNTTKLTTVVDWENLTEQGWFPNTRMPGNIDEPTNQALLNQLGHAMEIASIVIGRDTVMLTTFENAAQRRDTEVYSVGDVIDGQMTPRQLDQLITETMGVDQLTPPNATVIYFAPCKCLVAHAPQIIQQQIGSIVDELSQSETQ